MKKVEIIFNLHIVLISIVFMLNNKGIKFGPALFELLFSFNEEPGPNTFSIKLLLKKSRLILLKKNEKEEATNLNF